MKIVAVKERSEGNESVGNEWVETAIFSPEAPISEVIAWASRSMGRRDAPDQSGKYGRLMLTVADEPLEGNK